MFNVFYCHLKYLTTKYNYGRLEGTSIQAHHPTKLNARSTSVTQSPLTIFFPTWNYNFEFDIMTTPLFLPT